MLSSHSLPDVSALGLPPPIASEFKRALEGMAPDASHGRRESSKRTIASLIDGSHIKISFLTPEMRKVLGLEEDDSLEEAA